MVRAWKRLQVADSTKLERLRCRAAFLGGSNGIAVETNVAMRGVDRRVAGLFARDETEKTVLLHNGKIGGGQEGVGKKAFMKWYSKRYPGRMTIFSDPSCDDDKKEAAILVAELDSPEFVSQIESFVDDVRRFKDAVRGLNDDLGEMSESDLGEKAAAARKKPPCARRQACRAGMHHPVA